MKILLVTDVLGQENNGTTIAAMNFIRALRKNGHEVRILCADQDKKDEPDYFIVDNLSLGKILDKYVHKVGVTLAKPVKKIIENAMDGVDYVHIMLPFALGKAALKIAKKKGLPVTAGFHCQAENFTAYLKLNRLRLLNHLVYKNMYRKFYKYVDGIHYPTQFIKDVFESHIKKQTNGYIISNGVNRQVHRKEIAKPEEYKDKIVILSTGRYAREKSQDVLINAINRSKYRDKIQLILAGQGVKEQKYKRLAKKLPIPPVFKFFSRDEVINVLNYADMYVHSADIELEGIACLEAIACGKLVIVSSSELSATKNFAVDNKCIFKNRNAKHLANVIDYFIENRDEKYCIEQKNLFNAKIYDQDVCMDHMEKMIKEIYEKVA
ncbi:MAG: glycosyltransferase [Clostridia bacterium]|nr:glycosyltransferase [Clostridia bacterium]